jgi:predicted enzyme related to lactoylglutathione lyase
MLGPGSGGSPSSWQPVSLLFEHAVCGIHDVTPEGPPASWVAVVAVPDLEAALERARAEGFRTVDYRKNCYLVDPHGIWTRLVDADRVPVDIDPDTLGNTLAEINLPAPRDTLEAYARILDLDVVQTVDDFVEFYMLLDDGVLALSGVWYDPEMVREVGPAWLVYFEVPEIEATVERAIHAGVQVALPLVKEDWNSHTVLLDPFGTPFALCNYVDVDRSEMRVRRTDGEVVLLRDAVRLLVDPRH